MPITKRPEQLIEGDYISNWVAVGHPSNKAIFQFQRKDSGYLITRVSSEDTVQITGLSPDIVAYAGSKIYAFIVNAEITGNIVSIIPSARGTTITTDIPWDDSYQDLTSGGYVNITSNQYTLTFKLYNNDTGALISTSIHEGGPSGLITYDAGPYLRSEMEVKCEIDNTLINRADKKLSIPFYITYQETVALVESDLVDDSENVYTGVFASMRITDRWGQQLAYQTSVDDDLLEPNKGIFATRFDKPCYFPGYPFMLGVMYTGENVPWREEVFYDQNRQPLGGDSRQLVEDEDYTYFQQLSIKQGYEAAVTEVDVLLSQFGLQIGCLALDPGDFLVNWVLDENDELQFIDLTILETTQVLSIDTYPDALLYNNLGVLVETISHGGSGRYTPVSTHTIDTGIWQVSFTGIEVTLQSGDMCEISFTNDYNSAWCGIDYDAITYDLIVYPDV